MKETGLELKLEGRVHVRREGKHILREGSNHFKNYVIRMAYSRLTMKNDNMEQLFTKWSKED